MGEREIISASDYGEGGMTLRDYFAAKAMQGMLADQTVTGRDFSTWSEFCDEIANQSYDFADAMLAARGQEGGAS